MHTVAAVGQKRESHGLAAVCLLQWHLCSLDAPTVAVLWASLLAQVASVHLRTADLPVLGLGTWIVYVLDRVLDGAEAAPARIGLAAHGALLQERHYFHRRYRKIFLGLCCLASLVLALLCRWLAPALILAYLALGIPVAAYAVRVHRHLLWTGRATSPAGEPGLAKEAAVAILFTAAVAAPSLVEARQAYPPALLTPACLLALLCWVNCLLIRHAEERATPMRCHPRQLSPSVWSIGLAGIAAAVLVSSLHQSAVPSRGGLFTLRLASAAGAVLLSSLLLLALSVCVSKDALGPRRLRVLADLALLTPLLFLAARFRP